ncbi:MAG: hemin uptake protein HemP [Pirellulales bacterium]|nr:hemin uptake protein HemP [Pirellulales bacterium]
MSDPPVDHFDAAGPEGTGQPAEARILRSDDLLSGRREVIIEHGTEIYRLRLTRNGKLILQK